MIRILFLVLLFTKFLAVNGQIADNWVFGYNSGLSFSSGSPMFQPSSISQKRCPGITGSDTIAASYSNSISNCSGNLLFYTNGSIVWNGMGSLMPNYCLNDSVYSNGYEDTRILKFPGNDSLYYIFYTIKTSGIRYAIINIKADSGRGNLLSSHNFINSTSNVFHPELIKHSNDTDFWLVCKPNANQIYAYLISFSGISLTPIISTCAGYKSNEYPIRASLSGNYLLYFDKAISGYLGAAYCCDFNRFSGSITNIKLLFSSSIFANPNIALRSFEFSPNDSFVYTSTSLYSQNTARITQFKRYLSNPGSFPIDLIFLNNHVPGMRVAPDGKIYMFNAFSNNISCITRPNEISFGCNFVTNYITHPSFNNAFNFPSVYFQLRRLKFASNAFTPSSCITDSVYLTVQGDTTFLNYRWYIYNSADSLIDSTDVKNPVLWLTNGTYKIKLRAQNPQCNTYTWWTDNIYVNRNPKLTAVIDSTAISCARHFVRIKYFAVADSIKINWNDGSNSNWLKADTLGYFTHYYYDSSFVYSITISAKNMVCTITTTLLDSVKIQPKPNAKFYSNNSTKTFPIAGCTPLTINLSDSSKNADSVWCFIRNATGTKYPLTSTLGVINYVLTDTGWFDIAQYTSTKDGCLDSFIVLNAVYNAPLPTLVLQKDSSYKTCINNFLRLKITASYNLGTSINWGDGNTDNLNGSIGAIAVDTITHVYSNPGVYNIAAISNNAYCADQKLMKHLVRPPLQLLASNDTTICYGRSANLWASATGADSVFSYILKNGTSITQNSSGVFSVIPLGSTTYRIGAINACAKDTIWKQITVTVKPALSVSVATTDTTICKGSNYTIKAMATGGDTLAHRFNLVKAGIILQTNTTGVFTVIADTTKDYFIVLEDSCSINDTAKCRISIFAPLNLSPISDTTLCRAGSITLNAKAIGGDTSSHKYTLYESGVITQTNTNGIFTFFVNASTFYAIVVTDTCLSKDSINFSVFIRQPIKVSLNVSDTIICKGASLLLKATAIGGNGNYRFSLFNSVPNLISTNSTGVFTIVADSSSTFKLVVMDNCNSIADSAILKITVNLGIIKDTVSILYTTVLDSITTYTIWNKLPGAVNYNIRNTIANDTFFVHKNASPALQSERYFVTANDVCGNKSIVSNLAQTIYLTGENENFNAYAVLQYTPYETWQNGVLQYEIEYFDNTKQEWVKRNTEPGNVLNTKTDILSDSLNYEVTTSKICYRVKAIEKNGNQQVSVSNGVCIPIYPVVFLPNAFSPNADGLNDFYKPVCAGLNAYIFEVYDRWGQLVYTDTPESKGWDGTFRGEPAASGTYVFRLSAAGYLKSTFTNDARLVERQGTIYLVR